MIVSINEAYDEFYFYTNVNPFEENRGEEEQVDYDKLYNQKHIRHYGNREMKHDLESVDENDLYHYHFGDFYESISNIEIHKEVIESIQKQQEAFESENDNSETRKRLYESDDENDHNFTQFGDIFTFTLRANPETKEKCLDTLEYYHTFHVSFC